MTLLRYEPWSMLNQLHNQLNRAFEREYDDATASSSATADWIPPADIEEYKDRFVLKLDVPGVDVSAVDITLDQGVLSVGGERARDAQESEVERSRCERPHGRFHRRFTLPDTADAAAVHATGRNGIIEVTIPKQAKAQPRRIQVASA
ncbi:MAG TPA: Hsp20/alpha crystallin family protein [Steroidobacter sp.]|jgi:HSP20 family protein|nr:Hsp20/alpha crystallin family protein [Steroidobacter sp.]